MVRRKSEWEKGYFLTASLPVRSCARSIPTLASPQFFLPIDVSKRLLPTHTRPVEPANQGQVLQSHILSVAPLSPYQPHRNDEQAHDFAVNPQRQFHRWLHSVILTAHQVRHLDVGLRGLAEDLTRRNIRKGGSRRTVLAEYCRLSVQRCAEVKHMADGELLSLEVFPSERLCFHLFYQAGIGTITHYLQKLGAVIIHQMDAINDGIIHQPLTRPVY
jgi:hypothetical protein